MNNSIKLLFAIGLFFVSAAPVFASTVVTDPVASNTQLNLAGSPYVVSDGYLKINTGVTLTLDPGVEITGNIGVYGSLVANGATSSPVIINGGVIAEGGATTTISSAIVNGGIINFGVPLELFNTVINANSNSFSGDYAVYIGGGSFIHASTTITGSSTEKGFIVYLSGMTQDMTWANDNDIPYIIEAGDDTVPSGLHLTVEPGVIIKIAQISDFNFGYLINGGTINFLGSTSSPIRITSIKDDSIGGDTNSDGSLTSPAPGDWRGFINALGSAMTFDHTVFSYSVFTLQGTNFTGSNSRISSSTVAALDVNHSTFDNMELLDNAIGINNCDHLTIHNSTITGSTSGVVCGSFTGSSLTYNWWGDASGPYNATFNPSGLGDSVQGSAPLYSPWLGTSSSPVLLTGSVTQNTTLESDVHIVYIVSGILTIAPGATLSVEPGATLKFDTATTSGIVVNGILDIPYDEFSSATVLTSLKDDLLGRDTNGDAASTSPAAGDWAGIQINSGGVATLDGALIRYGGSVGGSGAMIYNNGGSVNISSSTIVYGSGYGIKNSSGTTTVTVSDLGFNDYGLYVSGGSASITASSTIHNNTTYGIYNSTGSMVNAEDNWWATSTGPYNASSNPTGGGGSVSDNVDFTPYKSSTNPVHYLLSYQGWPPSVSGCLLRYDASTTAYSSQLSDAVSTWNNLGRVDILAATSSAIDLNIYDDYKSDVVWKGRWDPVVVPNAIQLNSYYLPLNSYDEVRNTITHELGHALGLDHSYTGNVMFLAQSSQTVLGSQDVLDYEFIWQPKCI